MNYKIRAFCYRKKLHTGHKAVTINDETFQSVTKVKSSSIKGMKQFVKTKFIEYVLEVLFLMISDFY